TRRVYPSAGWLLTKAAATAPPPPGLFSTMAGWPSDLASLSASRRATMSLLPPGAKPTTMRMGRLGQASVCADASGANDVAMKPRTASLSSHGNFKSLPALGSLRLEIDGTQQRAWGRQMAGDRGRKFLRRAGQRLEPQRRQPLDDGRIARGFGQHGVDAHDDVFRQILGSPQAIPGGRDEPRQPGFRSRGNVRKYRTAAGACHRQRAGPPRLHQPQRPGDRSDHQLPLAA